MSGLKGVILAGGLGKRLNPLTKAENKHHLPVYDRRMIEYPLKTLTDSGCREIMIVLGGNDPGRFIDLLGSGSSRGCRITYAYQDGYGGIPEALKQAEIFCGNSQFLTVLGDNYFELPLRFDPTYPLSATIFLCDVEEPWHFGIATVGKDRKIIDIEEKPEHSRSKMAITGAYLFDRSVWPVLHELKESSRGETEITDVLRAYMHRDRLFWNMCDGFWHDMGTFKSWMTVSTRVELTRRHEARQQSSPDAQVS